MIKRLLLITLSLCSLSAAALTMLPPVVAFATGNCAPASPVCYSAATPSTDELCHGANFDENAPCSATGDDLMRIVRSIINTMSLIIGILAVIMIIWAGFKYVTSGGDSGSIQSAKNTLIYAIVGIIIVALAQFIVQFVLARIA